MCFAYCDFTCLSFTVQNDVWAKFDTGRLFLKVSAEEGKFESVESGNLKPPVSSSALLKKTIFAHSSFLEFSGKENDWCYYKNFKLVHFFWGKNTRGDVFKWHVLSDQQSKHPKLSSL